MLQPTLESAPLPSGAMTVNRVLEELSLSAMREAISKYYDISEKNDPENPMLHTSKGEAKRILANLIDSGIFVFMFHNLWRWSYTRTPSPRLNSIHG